MEGAANIQTNASAAPSWAAVMRGLLTDRALHVVLLVWATCWLSLGVYLSCFSTSLPFCDEWDLIEVATGREPVAWAWLWRPANEHRAPLTRLEVILLGRLNGWDLHLARSINLGLLALSSVALILATRSVRGHTVVSDAFLALLVLTPSQYQSVLLYAYAYAMALACFGLAVSAVMTGWPLRSLTHLVLYLFLVLAVDFSGGPAGNVWALSLCAVFLRGWLEKKPRSWRWAALAGTAVVASVSVGMLLSVPRVLEHARFQSESLDVTLWAANQVALSWLGRSFLKILFPWAWLVVILPGCYVLARILLDVDRLARRKSVGQTSLTGWLDLVPVLLAALAVAGLVGQGRAHYPDLWDSRYATLLLPVGVALYLLLVRLRAPMLLPVTMTFVMAVSVGWNWPEVIRAGHYWHGPAAEMARALKMSQQPLSVLSLRYASKVGYACDPTKLLNALLLLRDAKLSVFRADRQKECLPGMGRPLVWKAETGQYDQSFRLIPDAAATRGRALQADATAGQPATVIYRVAVPANGSYLLCCRLRAPVAGRVLGVRVDDGPTLKGELPAGSGYFPYCVEPLLDLRAGQHRLAVSLFEPGVRMDLLELIPRAGEDVGDRHDG